MIVTLRSEPITNHESTQKLLPERGRPVRMSAAKNSIVRIEDREIGDLTGMKGINGIQALR